MSSKSGMVVKEYLAQLKDTKRGKPSQIRDALDVYVELWEGAIRNGTISGDDDLGEALSKLDKAGGLYEAGG